MNDEQLSLAIDIMTRDCEFGCTYNADLDCVQVMKECLFHHAIIKE